jgi:hypothetical protein
MLANWKNKNDLAFGTVLGLLTPIVGTFIVFLIFGLLVQMNIMDESYDSIYSKRIRTIILIGICSNIYWIQKYNSRFTSQTSRGIVLATMAYSVGWFIFYFSSLYNE